MTTETGYAASAALGAVLGLGMVAASAAATARLGRARPVRRPGAAVAWGAGLRMLGALAGITIGVGVRPASVATFVVVFLVTYLTGHGVLTFRFGS